MMDKKITDIIDVIIADVFADVALDCFVYGNKRAFIDSMDEAAAVFLPYWQDKRQKMLEDIPDKLEGMDTEEDDAHIVIYEPDDESEPHAVYKCPDCKAALEYLMNRLYQINCYEKLFAEMEHHGFIVDPTINLYGPEEIAETLNSRPELVDFFKAFMDLDERSKKRIMAATSDTNILTALNNMVGGDLDNPEALK